MEKKVIKKKKNSNRIILISVLVIGSLFGAFKFYQAQRFETTDDAQLETDISPVSGRISGYISRVNFTDNQLVKMSDTLVIIDDRDLRIKVEQAEAALENAKAILETTRESARSVKENGGTAVYKIDELKIRLANAQKEFERYKKMLAEKSVTQQQFDKIQTDKDALEQQLEAALQLKKESDSKTSAANQQIKVSGSTIAQRQSDLDFARLQLSYAVITAPFDGIASKRNAVPGQLLQAGQPLCSIVSSQNIWVVANFKETQLSNIKIGMKVIIESDAFPGDIINGEIESFASATGSKFSLIPPDNATGNFVKVVQRVPVKIKLDSNNPKYKDLKPGMSVYVKVKIKA